MGFFTTVYLTGLLVSALWLCLSEEITNPHKRFALIVGWPLVLLYGVYEAVLWSMEFVDDVERGHVDVRSYLYNLVLGDSDDCTDDMCCGHTHDHDDSDVVINAMGKAEYKHEDDDVPPVKRTRKVVGSDQP